MASDSTTLNQADLDELRIRKHAIENARAGYIMMRTGYTTWLSTMLESYKNDLGSTDLNINIETGVLTPIKSANGVAV